MSSIKWYENKEILNICKKCDEAFENQDIDSCKRLSEDCFEKGHNDNYSDMEKAKLLYCALTSLGDWIRLSSIHDINNGIHTRISAMMYYEKYYERALYLSRQALEAVGRSIEHITFEDKLEYAHFSSFHNSLIVNYSNLLYETGRLIKSIEKLTEISHRKFAMGLGNLGLKLIYYAQLDYDKGHSHLINQKAYQFLEKSLTTYPTDPNLYQESREDFLSQKEYLLNFYGPDFLNHTHNFEKLDMEEPEKEYREWCVKNKLCLNSLNEISDEIDIAYDPIHLPSILRQTDEGIDYSFHGLMNQIKQEYASARYFIFEGLEKGETHFSDKHVTMINTLDYPIYGLGIEKVKAGYRAIYSIFDRIAYFINKYFKLELDINRITYKKIWKNKETNKLYKIMKENYPLIGLYWLFKDISNTKIDDKINHYLDPVISEISNIRNAMEHRYLKILNIYGEIIHDTQETETGSYEIKIGYSKFKYLTLNLIKYAKEAIFLLIMSIYVEEKKILGTCNDKNIPRVPVDNYEDNWKFI